MIGFPCLEMNKCVIGIVGAGGKTTLMMKLANEYASRGLKVLVTTTTHIYKPEKNYANSFLEVEELWQSGGYAVVGKDGEKLSPLESGILSSYMSQADITIYEADGSKQLPCKAPAAHEPVLLDETDIVIDVVGISALGKQIKDCCHRVEKVCKLLGKSQDDVLVVDDIITLASSEFGGRKNVGNRDYYVVINQCDDERLMLQGQEIIKKLGELKIDNAYAVCLKDVNISGLK